MIGTYLYQAGQRFAAIPDAMGHADAAVAAGYGCQALENARAILRIAIDENRTGAVPRGHGGPQALLATLDRHIDEAATATATLANADGSDTRMAYRRLTALARTYSTLAA